MITQNWCEELSFFRNMNLKMMKNYLVTNFDATELFFLFSTKTHTNTREQSKPRRNESPQTVPRNSPASNKKIGSWRVGIVVENEVERSPEQNTNDEFELKTM